MDEEKIEKEEKVETVPEEPESQVDKEQIKRDEEAKKASMAGNNSRKVFYFEINNVWFLKRKWKF